MTNLRFDEKDIGRDILCVFAITACALVMGVTALHSQSEQARQVTRSAGTSCEAVPIDSVSDVNSLAAALQNRIAGLQISTRTGHVGSGTGTRVRGNSSVTGSNEPLIVVDDIPLRSVRTNTVTRSFSAQSFIGALDFLDPSDIAQVDILRGPAATTRYGMDAAGGVIRVYTKRGQQKGGSSARPKSRCPN